MERGGEGRVHLKRNNASEIHSTSPGLGGESSTCSMTLSKWCGKGGGVVSLCMGPLTKFLGTKKSPNLSMKEVGLHHYTFLGLFMDSTSSENSNSVDFDTLRGKFFFAIKRLTQFP